MLVSRDPSLLRVKLPNAVISIQPRYALTLATFNARTASIASLKLSAAAADTYLRRCIACFQVEEPESDTTLEALLDIVKARMCLAWSWPTNPWRRDAPSKQTVLAQFVGSTAAGDA